MGLPPPAAAVTSARPTATASGDGWVAGRPLMYAVPGLMTHSPAPLDTDIPVKHDKGRRLVGDHPCCGPISSGPAGWKSAASAAVRSPRLARPQTEMAAHRYCRCARMWTWHDQVWEQEEYRRGSSVPVEVDSVSPATIRRMMATYNYLRTYLGTTWLAYTIRSPYGMFRLQVFLQTYDDTHKEEPTPPMETAGDRRPPRTGTW